MIDTIQKSIIDSIFINKENIFLTGGAGVGKSYTLQELIRTAKEYNRNIGITATTGTAGILIGGQTLHSYLGIGLGKEDVDTLYRNIRTKLPKVYAKLLLLDLLIIDEISMLDAELFEKISKLLSKIKLNLEPFGGIQIILCGDAAQLKPVSGNYCFLSTEWTRLNPKLKILKKNYRQSEDELFQKILNKLRWGSHEKYKKYLENLMNTVFPDNIEPTRLYSLNINVDKINEDHFNKVSQNQTIYNYIPILSYGTLNDKEMESFINQSRLQKEIKLCKGLQVMCTWNITGTNLVNGSRGVIHDLNNYSVTIKLINGNYAIIEYITIKNSDDETATISFLPIKLAAAVSIHKSQGMTLDCVEMDLGDSIFEYGQAYTALSRAKNMNSVKILKLNMKSFKTDPNVLRLYNKIE